MKEKQNGFGLTGVFISLIVLVVLAGAGYVIWIKQAAPAAQPVRNNTTSEKNNQVAFVNVIQSDDSVVQLTADKAAKTADQAAILNALHDLPCSGETIPGYASGRNVTINHVTFEASDNETDYKQSGNYAEINASTCDPAAKTSDQLPGSGSATYLHKTKAGTWTLDQRTQMGYPQCSKVDGAGYPSSIIGLCVYDDTTGATRAPR